MHYFFSSTLKTNWSLYKIISSEIKEKSLVIIDYVNDQFVFKVEEKK